MSQAQFLHNYYPALSCSGKLLECVTTAKILGVHMDEHLTWADHVTVLLSSCYAALAVFPKMESILMSKLDYRCVIFYPLPEYHNETAAKSSNNFRRLLSGQDEGETPVESGSGSSETRWLSLLLTGWCSAVGRWAPSLLGLSEKSGTRTRVSPSLGITKELAKLT